MLLLESNNPCLSSLYLRISAPVALRLTYLLPPSHIVTDSWRGRGGRGAYPSSYSLSRRLQHHQPPQSHTLSRCRYNHAIPATAKGHARGSIHARWSPITLVPQERGHLSASSGGRAVGFPLPTLFSCRGCFW
ncbi:hypothetical protein LIA77_09860 [Sarocladium implicatum]|nr:hypothetical protein LIA77_09860 [Sarocladium implicatum]